MEGNDGVELGLLKDDEENNMVVYGDENWGGLWEVRRREAVVQVAAYTAYLASLITIYYQFRNLRGVIHVNDFDSYMSRSSWSNNMGKRKTMDGSTTSSLRWTMRMDTVFLDALMNEATCGNRVDGIFTSRAYENVIKECTEKLSYPFTKDHLKNRLKTIKSNFNEVFDLFGASGWVWNDETKMFENEDEVWESLLEIKPEAKKWKTAPFHHFDLLVKLFPKDRATGEDAGTAKEKRMQMNSNCSESGDKSESAVEVEVEVKTDESRDPTHSKKRKRKVVDDFLREQISTIKQGLDNVAQALREGTVRVYTCQEIFQELSRMKLDKATHRKAYRFLNAKQGRMRELFGCPPDERKEYLMETMIDEGV